MVLFKEERDKKVSAKSLQKNTVALQRAMYIFWHWIEYDQILIRIISFEEIHVF